jgi:hypothetical protein
MIYFIEPSVTGGSFKSACIYPAAAFINSSDRFAAVDSIDTIRHKINNKRLSITH